MLEQISFAKLLAGTIGSAVSLRFIKGCTPIEKGIMFIGGCALSYYAAPPIARWVNVPDVEGLIGFMVGLFGMTIIAKLYEVIMLLDAKQIAVDFWEWVKRKWGA